MFSLEMLVAFALIASIASMLLSCAALWPHSKDGMATIRDAILWGAFIFVISGAATVGWKRLNGGQQWDSYAPSHDAAVTAWQDNLIQPARFDRYTKSVGRPSMNGTGPVTPMFGMDPVRSHPSIQTRNETY